MVLIAGGVPVVVPCTEANGFRITPEQLEAAITPTHALGVHQLASNPSGAAYSAEQLRPVLEVVERHPQVWLLADDIYEHILRRPRVCHACRRVAVTARPHHADGERCLKSYAMTGWRLGYGAGPRRSLRPWPWCRARLRRALVHQPGGGRGGADRAARRGARALPAFQARRDLVVAALNASPGLRCRVPEGAFYTLPVAKACWAAPRRAACCCAPMPTSAPTCCASTMSPWCPVVYWGWHHTSAFRTPPLPPICRKPAHASSAPARPCFEFLNRYR